MPAGCHLPTRVVMVAWGGPGCLIPSTDRGNCPCMISSAKFATKLFDERRRHYTVDRLARRIEHLGYQVHLELLPVTAV